MFILRPKKRKAVPVGRSWRRLEAWLKEKVPETAAALRPGCRGADLASFQEKFGLTLPNDVKESFRIHDGQTQWIAAGVIAGQPLDSLDRVRSSLSVWRSSYSDEQEADSGLGDRATSFPPDAIRCDYATPNWVPMGDWDGNCYGIDLNPGPNGILGQVINFGRNEDDKYVLALSWAHFLEDVTDELEAGGIVAIPASEGAFARFGRPGCHDYALSNFYKEWSLAKLPTSFQNVKPARKARAMFPGVVIHNELAERAKRVVLGFIRALHGFETYWIAHDPCINLSRKALECGEDRDRFFKCAEEAFKRRKGQQKKAGPQRDAILKRFATPRKRVLGEVLTSLSPMIYEPDRNTVAEVRQAAPDHLVVYMDPVDGFITRYHLKLTGGRWLIDSKDKTTDHVTFKKLSLL
jgi:cell wall assembly regulator SMI1